MRKHTTAKKPNTYEEKVEKAASFLSPFIEKRFNKKMPQIIEKRFELVALTLGTGMGKVVKLIENPMIIPYKDIPNFPTPTVSGHAGNLYIGSIEDVPILGLEGRKHFYEVGNKPGGILEVVFPTHVVANVGAKTDVVFNATGGLDWKNHKAGDLSVISSHMALGIPNPLIGENMNFSRVDDGKGGLRFPSMDEAYDEQLGKLFHRAGRDPKHIHEGFYLAVTGPTYESRFECLAYRKLGARTVGMSIVPEVIVARYRGMRCLGVNFITNVVGKDGKNKTNHEEVNAVLNSPEVEERVSGAIQRFFALYRDEYM